MNISRKRKIDKLINSSLTFKKANFNFISLIHKIIIKANLKVPNKRIKDKNKENIKSFYKKLYFYDLITFLFISTIFNLSYQNSEIYGYSYITLKVSRTGQQNIFNNGHYFTKPNEVWIDTDKMEPFYYNYNLNPTNIIKLIWTDEITSCKYMFKDCNTIKEINFIDFDAQKCNDTNNMFQGCTSLISMELSGFKTSDELINMSDMFWNCISLISLNLSNFDISNVSNFGHLLYNCESLEFIVFSQVKTDKITLLDNMFNGCKNLISVNLSNFYTTNLEKIQYMFSGCESLKFLDFANLDITNVNEENSNNVFLNCKNLEYINIKNFRTNNDFDSIFFDGIPYSLIICIDNTELIKEIIDIDKYKSIKENGCLSENCTLTKYKYEFQGSCYENCPSNSKIRENSNELKNFLLDENYFCQPICNETFPFELILKQECARNCPINSIINGLCILNLINYKNEIEYYNIIIKNIENDYTSGNYDTINLDKGQDVIIKTGKITTTLTTSKNQKNSMNNNMTRIDIGECETLLRNFYNISINESLYIKKIDIIQEGMSTLKVEYNIYAKLFGNKLIKLNLTECKNSKISISIPFAINEDLDKYNSSSGYYNDICYTTTSHAGTDILLQDRQKEFIDNDKIVCQQDCEFSQYDYYTLVAKCSCEVKECSESFADMKIDKNKLLDNFKNIKNIINFEFLKCYKKFFNKEGFLNNIGCFILLAIIFFHILSIFIFIISQFSSIVKKIIDILDLSQLSKYPSGKEIIKEEKIVKRKTKRSRDKKIYINNNKIKKNKNKHFYNKKPQSDSKIKINRKNVKNYKVKNDKIKIFIDEEINGFTYNLAIEYDKRTYCQYYASLLKTQHSLICALFNNTDYNSRIIKINLFCIGFTIEYIVNALFYNDDTMHEIYEKKGDFDLTTQIPIAVYSTLISMILNYPLNFLALSNDSIINFKQDNTQIDILKKSKDLIKILTIKFIIYFIISFLLLIFFWYYISMFGVIYRNTQFHLLKDTLMSFGLSLIFPFFIYLLPGILRIPSLSNVKKKRVCLYNLSKFIQSF